MNCLMVKSQTISRLWRIRSGAATGDLARPANYTEAVAEFHRRDPVSDELDDAERLDDLLVAQNEHLLSH